MNISSYKRGGAQLRWIASGIALLGISLIVWMSVLPTPKEEGSWHDVTEQIASVLEQDDEEQQLASERSTSNDRITAKTEEGEAAQVSIAETPKSIPIAEPQSDSRQEQTTDSSEVIVPNSEASPVGRVNVNEASAEQLMTLPGIGPSKAKAIIDYRTKHGIFQKPEDMLEVKGIGKKILDNMLDQLYFPSTIIK